MVGLTELESVTSCVSSRRSNQLSYKPLGKILNSQPGVHRHRNRSPAGVQTRPFGVQTRYGNTLKPTVSL
jgi:hypothetical protein